MAGANSKAMGAARSSAWEGWSATATPTIRSSTATATAIAIATATATRKVINCDRGVNGVSEAEGGGNVGSVGESEGDGTGNGGDNGNDGGGYDCNSFVEMAMLQNNTAMMCVAMAMAMEMRSGVRGHRTDA